MKLSEKLLIKLQEDVGFLQQNVERMEQERNELFKRISDVDDRLRALAEALNVTIFDGPHTVRREV